ncbi:MAG TPA: hypothetical protein VMJ12_00750 [Candidatus Acidoferrales bacterium]|nr:hypothetical protein [Candidatus Acidoferrales bacterium]
MATFTMVAGQSNLDTTRSLGFFTNVASRLLSGQMDVNLTHIQVYPTNQYTPAVHRLLQVAANIYEATSSNSFPSVFRPLFSRDADGLGTNLFISGFTNVDSVTGPTDSQLALPVDGSVLAMMNIPAVNLPVNVYGIPWIISAKKGFPNFNKFDMESAFQLFRKMQATRQSTNDTFTSNPSDYGFNQLFNLSVFNQLGVECWNSYADSFNDSVAIYVRDNLAHAVLTNDEGFSADFPVFPIAGSIVITNGNVWPGYNPVTDPLGSLQSFQIPLYTNVIVIPNSIYRFNNGSPFLTTNLLLPYEQNVTVNGQLDPQPHWWLNTSNDVQVFMLDITVVPNRVIDYVQLSGPNTTRDLTSEIITNYDAPVVSAQASGSELWNTNYQSGRPIGLLSQIGISLGNYTASAASGTWDQSSPSLLANEIAGFNAFFGYAPPPPYTPGELQAIAAASATTSIQTPFIPMATVVQHTSWQANDPLVHYLASDLNWQNAVVLDRYVDNLTNNNPNGTLGILNQSYRPWGGNPLMAGSDPNPYNLALKDPLVRRSDDWDFPTNESLSGAWLGRVHRGTPWQTIYLKASDILDQTNGSGTDIGTNTWLAWTGDTDATDAVAMAPVQDWHLASLLAYLMNTNDLQSLLSVNNPNTNTWLNLFNGLMALTNDLSDTQIASGTALEFDPLVISSNSPQASFMVNAIQSAQASQPGDFFRDVGDILAIPRLTEQSPFLNWNDSVQQQGGISDEAYEIIPSQLLTLLRADSIGSITSTKGQITAQFTGYDDHTYAIEGSSNLVDWKSINTNLPAHGAFSFTNAAPANAKLQFYRSVLLQ